MSEEQHLYTAAQVAIQGADFVTAFNLMTKVIEINKSNAVYYATRAGICNCMRKFKECIQDTSVALHLDPSFFRSYQLQGYAFYNLGMYKEALRIYNKGKKLEPDNQMLNELLRKVIKKMEEKKEKIEDIEQQYEDEWLKGVFTKLAIHVNYSNYLKDPKFVFKMELIDKSPQLATVLSKSDPKIKDVMTYLSSSESNLTAQEQKEQQKECKTEEMSDISEKAKKDSEKEKQEQQIQKQKQQQEQQKKQEEETKQNEKIQQENQNQEEQINSETSNWDLSRMEKVFSTMAMEIKGSLNDNNDPLNQIFQNMNQAVKVPGNILEKENEIQNKIRYDIKNSIYLGDSENKTASTFTTDPLKTQSQEQQFQEIKKEQKLQNNIQKQEFTQNSGMQSASQGSNLFISLKPNNENEKLIEIYKKKLKEEQEKQKIQNHQEFQAQNSISFASMQLEPEPVQSYQKKEQKPKKNHLDFSTSDPISISISSNNTQKNNEKDEKDENIKYEKLDIQPESGTYEGKNGNIYSVKTVGTSDKFSEEGQKTQQEIQIQKLLVEAENNIETQELGYAMNALNKILKIDPKHFLAHIFKARIYVKQENHKKGHMILDDMLNFVFFDSVKISIIHQIRAVFYKIQGEDEKIIQEYISKGYDPKPSQNLQLQMQHITNYVKNLSIYEQNHFLRKAAEITAVADQLFTVGKYEYAIEEYNNALKIDKENPEIIFKKSNSLLKLKKFQEGLECLNQCLQINPRNPKIWLKKGYVHIFLKQNKEARACFELGLDIDPDHKELLKGLERTRELLINDLQNQMDEAISAHKSKKMETIKEEKPVKKNMFTELLESLEQLKGVLAESEDQESYDVYKIITDSEFIDGLQFLSDNPNENPKHLMNSQEFKKVFGYMVKNKQK